jgi:CheY-specific phosphatase CheX
MLGVESLVDGDSYKESSFAPSRLVLAMLHFTGPVEGDFVLGLEEETGARLIGAWSEGMSPEELRAARPDFGGMLKELLNTAVGMAIEVLERSVGRLTYHPPMIVYGEIDPPNLPSGTISLPSAAGTIDCTFVIDMAGNESERMLRQAVEDLRKARAEVAVCHRVLADLVSCTRRLDVPSPLLEEAEVVLREAAPFLEPKA